MQGHPMNSQKKQQTSTDSPIYLASGNYVRNPLFDNPSSGGKSSGTFDPMDIELESQYLDRQNHLQAPTHIHLQYLQPPPVETEHFLTGPMVFRVHPDGK